MLWLGSSIGNLNRTEAAEFLKGFAEILRPQDAMMIAIDACQDKKKVFHAYNDREGKTHDFVLNGLTHANRLMGTEVFKVDGWKVVGEFDVEAGRHQAFYSPVRDVIVEGISIKSGEKIRVEESYKYSSLQSSELWQRASLVPHAKYGNETDDYREQCPCIHMLFFVFANLRLRFEDLLFSDWQFILGHTNLCHPIT